MPDFAHFSSDSPIISSAPLQGVLFSKLSGVVLEPARPIKPSPSRVENVVLESAAPQVVDREVPLIRLSATEGLTRGSIILQRWTGLVEQVTKDSFLAVVSDRTNPLNPPEEVELDLQEVSKSDRSLVAPGATFYWSIGYRDSEGGQRVRISSLRFARQPHLSEADVNEILEEAADRAAFLESA